MDTFETKYSTLDKNVSFVFGVFITLLFLLIMIAAIVNYSWVENHRDTHTYLFECAESSQFIAFIGSLTMFLILTPMIPL